MRGEKESPALLAPMCSAGTLPPPQYTFESLYSTSVEPTGIFLAECFPRYFCNLIKSSFLLPAHQPPYHPLKSAQRLRLCVSSFSQCHTSFGHRKFHSKMLLFWPFQNETLEFSFQGKWQDFIWYTIISLGNFQWEKKFRVAWI